MKIEKYTKKYQEQVKDLLVELQKFVIEIDEMGLNIISKEYRDKYFENMQQNCKENQGAIFLAVENGQVYGMVAGWVEQYSDADRLVYSCPKKGLVEELIISQTKRSHGIGNQLLNKMEKYFKQIGCQYCQLDVFGYNERGLKFYKKNGYSDERMITLMKKF